MTFWRKGNSLVFDKKIDDWFVTELIRPKMAYLLMVFLSEKKFYYALRYWRGAETPWTKPKLIDSPDFLKKVQTFISQRDKYPQAFVQKTDFIIDCSWINANDLEEIKKIEGEEKPP